MTVEELAEALKSFRLNQNMSQEEMAKEMGVSRTMYQAYEGGRAVPSALVLANFAEAKKVSVDYLIGRVATPNNIYAPANEETLKIVSEVLMSAAKDLQKFLPNQK